MLKKIGILFACFMFFIASGAIVSAKNIHRMKLEAVEKVLLRGMTDIGPKQQVKIDAVFDEYANDAAKVMRGKEKEEKKVKKLVKLRKKRDKKMQKVLSRNQWKVYEENLKILEEHYKEKGINSKKGTEFNILD